jgi:hypothetical protein
MKIQSLLTARLAFVIYRSFTIRFALILSSGSLFSTLFMDHLKLSRSSGPSQGPKLAHSALEKVEHTILSDQVRRAEDTEMESLSYTKFSDFKQVQALLCQHGVVKPLSFIVIIFP